MDLRKTIEELHRQREHLKKVILALEELQGAVTGAPLKMKRRNKTSLKPKPSENSRES
jgi:hypothetical protein